MSFRILGLAPDAFRRYFELDDARLLALGARRMVADGPGYPCRVSLEEAAPGEEVLLVNFEHQPADTPYRSRHAIFVRRDATRAYDAVGEVPASILTRLVSVRAFDAAHMMTEAEVAEGTQAAALFRRFLSDPAVSYLHVHNAKRGCYAARVERAPLY